MATLHRALFTWFLFLVFLILLAVRLDEKTSWNWFIVFIPMWLFDSLLLAFAIFRLLTHCKNAGHDAWWHRLHHTSWHLISVLLKMTFQAFLCAKLEYNPPAARSYYVAIPLWLLLTGITLDVGTHLVGLHQTQ